MAKKSSQTFAKRAREQARQERQAQKRARKRARALAKRQGGDSDPGRDSYEFDEEDIQSQRAPAPSAAEVERAVQRAMYPGKEAAARRREGAAISRLFVGNLPYGTTARELRELFKEIGCEMQDAALPVDRNTGEPRGFAFVELAKPDEAQKAIDELDGKSFHGRELRVNAATQRN